ncbi:MAG: helix-turn-helix domain-containing protein [Rhodospirillaceae bacterium]|nr:helix-turn-helix domain-containing protein [Rhodospirillaceae bacterium]
MDLSNLDSLTEMPWFAALSATALAEVKGQSFIQSQPAEAILFEQGQTAQFLHVILTGRVALVGSSTAHSDPDHAAELEATDQSPAIDREAIIEIFGAGDVVTIAAVLLNLPYMMSARVIAPSRIAYIPASLIRHCLDHDAGFAREVALMLARHWRLLSRQLKDQKLRSGTQRLGAYLLTLSDGRTSGRAEIEMPMDRRTLASWLGMSAENLSRALAQLKSVGIRVSGRRAVIDDIARIRAFCLEDDLR